MDLKRLTKTNLEAWLMERGEKSYRAGQILKWVYQRGATSFAEMSDLSVALRTLLAQSFSLDRLACTKTTQAVDGTRKFLFALADGRHIESVLIPAEDRLTLCISSQVGCAMGCRFCATAQMRPVRDLTTAEILSQIWEVQQTLPVGQKLTNLVFMGMGEPFINFDNVIAAARRLPDLGVTPRRTTISTVGWMPGLTRFIDEVDEPIRLALSLHAASPGLRSQLMPVNDRYPLPDVLAECRRYVELRGRKVYIEYVMLEGVNDTPRHAAELAAILDPKSFKVNLIPYNPTGMYGGSSRDAIAAFKHVLDRARIPATVRLTRGRDIAAACGQLAATR